MREIYYELQLSENKVWRRNFPFFFSVQILFFFQKLFLEQIKQNDPFFDVEEYNSLVGVANIFLKALFYDSKLDYLVPIINTQGEVEKSTRFSLILFWTKETNLERTSSCQIMRPEFRSLNECRITDNKIP